MAKMYPIVDVWVNPSKNNLIPEASRLFEQSHSHKHVTEEHIHPDELVARMDAAGISQICLCAWYRPSGPVFTNAQVAIYTTAHPSRIIGIASVNLHDPVAAVQELEYYVKEHNFKGLRVVPWLWNLPPTDPHYWPLYVKCIELSIPFLTQVGHTGPLLPSEVGRPIPYIDTVALKFPTLKIICGHLGYPWTDEMVAVAWKHENVFIDTSAWRPKYYPEALVRFMNTTGKGRVLFGTNFPQLGWAECVADVGEFLGPKLREGVLEAFMGGNARRVMGLNGADGGGRARL